MYKQGYHIIDSSYIGPDDTGGRDKFRYELAWIIS
jgi:hypothetical protein